MNKVYLTGPKADPNIEIPARGMVDEMQKVKESIIALKTEIANLSTLRDQAMITAMQYKHDITEMKSVLQKLKSAAGIYIDPGFQTASTQPIQQAQLQVTVPVTMPPPPPPPPPPQPPVQLAANSPQPVDPCKNIQEQAIQWQVKTNTDFSPKLRYALTTGAIICSVKISPNGQFIGFADGKTLFIRSAIDGSSLFSINLPATLSDPEPHTRALAFSPDNDHLVLGGNANAKNSFPIILISLLKRECIATLAAHTEAISSFAFTKDGSQLISCGFDGQLLLWDVRTQKLIKSIANNPPEKIISISFSPDYSQLAVGYMNGSIALYESTFTEQRVIFTAHPQSLMSLCYSSDKKIATTSHDKTVKIWVPQEGSIPYVCANSLSGHNDFIITGTFSLDGHILFTGSKDEQIFCWDVNSGAFLASISAHRNTVFEISHHPTEKSFVSCCGEGLVCMWDY